MMKSHQPLHIFKRQPGIIFEHPIVKAKKQTVQLRNDGVFIVARISNQGPRRVRIVARQIAGVRIAAGNRISKEKFPTVVHVRLIIRSSSINIVQIKGGRAKIDESVWIILFLKAACRVEGDIVIDKLAEVSIEGGNPTLLLVLAILWLVEIGRHGIA